jgi:hypothetical protein
MAGADRYSSTQAETSAGCSATCTVIFPNLALVCVGDHFASGNRAEPRENAVRRNTNPGAGGDPTVREGAV